MDKKLECEMNQKTFRIVVNLTEPRANALAQMVKRFTYEDAQRLSINFDGGKELNAMIDAIFDLKWALSARGFSPR